MTYISKMIYIPTVDHIPVVMVGEWFVDPHALMVCGMDGLWIPWIKPSHGSHSYLGSHSLLMWVSDVADVAYITDVKQILDSDSDS